MNRETLSAVLEPLLHHLVVTSGLSLTYAVEVSATQARPLVSVAFEGDDVTMLSARNGELLLAMEHIAATALRLEPEDHDLIRFEARGFRTKQIPTG